MGRMIDDIPACARNAVRAFLVESRLGCTNNSHLSKCYISTRDACRMGEGDVSGWAIARHNFK